MVGAPQRSGDVIAVERVAVPARCDRARLDCRTRRGVALDETHRTPARSTEGRDDVARGIRHDDVAVSVEADLLATFVHETVVEPTQLDEVPQLLTPTTCAVVDVMSVDERPPITSPEAATLVAGSQHASDPPRDRGRLVGRGENGPSDLRTKRTVDAPESANQDQLGPRGTCPQATTGPSQRRRTGICTNGRCGVTATHEWWRVATGLDQFAASPAPGRHRDPVQRVPRAHGLRPGRAEPRPDASGGRALPGPPTALRARPRSRQR
jgi:hypothetical protein